jgi:hypothetical protein
VILTGAFKIAYPWRRNNAYEPFEYACHEGNTLIWANIRSTSPRYAKWREENESRMASGWRAGATAAVARARVGPGPSFAGSAGSARNHLSSPRGFKLRHASCASSTKVFAAC